MASALYVGLITDTGKFMYENTNAHTHRVAAELIDAGVDVDDTYRRLYEHVPLEKLRLVARALDGIQRHCDGRLVVSYITAADYEATGAGEEMTEGVIDHLRSIEGTKVAAVVRDLGNRGRAARKVSLRSSEGDVDVSAIARKHGGGGHKRAAGFSTDLELDELVAFLCGEVVSQLGRLSMADGDAGGAVLLYDKPAGVTSHDVVAKVRRERGCKAGHAGTLDPFATGLLLILLGRATRLQRFLVGLPKTYLATARLGWRSSTGDPDGELTETGRVPDSLELPTGTVRQRVPMTSAVRVGGERLYKKAHRGEVVETPERDVEVYRAELLSGRRRPRPLRDRVLGRDLRPHPGRDPRRRLLRRAAPHRDRPLPGRGRRRGARASSGSPSWSRRSGRRCDEHRRSPRCPTPSRAPATSRSAPSTASTSATRR